MFVVGQLLENSRISSNENNHGMHLSRFKGTNLIEYINSVYIICS